MSEESIKDDAVSLLKSSAVVATIAGVGGFFGSDASPENANTLIDGKTLQQAAAHDVAKMPNAGEMNLAEFEAARQDALTERRPDYKTQSLANAGTTAVDAALIVGGGWLGVGALASGVDYVSRRRKEKKEAKEKGQQIT